ncbi:TIGR03089 family protein [Gordonia caeni]|uniref:TIGR03089 family protein n=1 Tax=Gordonia caeni TaxID=1007097 RepID=A0ABP7P974_9ACTN
MTHRTVTDAVLAATGDRARPLLTYYGPDQRVGLSGTTLENWAAKIANYLRDEAGLVPGDSVLVDLPEHWQTAAVLLGVWWAGLRVELPGDDATQARVVFADRSGIERQPDADELVVVPLDPFGGRVPDLPPFATDFGDTVRPHGDHFSPAGAGPQALGERSVAQVLSAAREAADRDHLAPGARVLSCRPWRTADEMVANLLGPLTAGAALIWVDPAADQDLSGIAATENADRTLD